MVYIQRELERKFLEAERFFKAVLVICARQVGKSTMLRHFAGVLIFIDNKHNKGVIVENAILLSYNTVNILFIV